VESAASGLLTGLETARELSGQPPADFPRKRRSARWRFMSAAACGRLSAMNINFGIISPLEYKVRARETKTRPYRSAHSKLLAGMQRGYQLKIIIDGMGGDNAPDEIVKGAAEACEELGVEIILTGKGRICSGSSKMGWKELPKGMQIANATEEIAMDEDPVAAIREKKDSSLSVGLSMLRDGYGDAFVSAGSTARAQRGDADRQKESGGSAALHWRPCCRHGKGRPAHRLRGQRRVHAGIPAAVCLHGDLLCRTGDEDHPPRVGLLISARSASGRICRSTLRAAGSRGEGRSVNFIGNVESKGVMQGECDVVVADGYTGNIMLKAVEGTASFLIREIKNVFMASAGTKLAALMVKKRFAELKERMDADRVGGTALLGISKPVIKAHGSSNAAALKGAVRQAVRSVEAAVAQDIENNIDRMKIPDPTDKI
jgi:glycerol-3-phosphate acyltransferase PlsX